MHSRVTFWNHPIENIINNGCRPIQAMSFLIKDFTALNDSEVTRVVLEANILETLPAFYIFYTSRDLDDNIQSAARGALGKGPVHCRTENLPNESQNPQAGWKTILDCKDQKWGCCYCSHLRYRRTLEKRRTRYSAVFKVCLLVVSFGVA